MVYVQHVYLRQVAEDGREIFNADLNINTKDKYESDCYSPPSLLIDFVEKLSQLATLSTEELQLQ